MTAQEQQLIDELIERIRATPLQNKDSDAEQRLQQGLANSPDALYILAQTVIVQKYGLEQAQARLQSLQSELDSARQQAAQTAHPSGGSFLSHIFGGGSSSSSSSQAAPAPPAPPSQAGWQPVSNAGYPQAAAVPPQGYPAPGYGYGQPSGWGGMPSGGGFLQSALQTAAGVAMGEMAFQSMESLFHGFGGGGGYGRGFEGGQPSETIINNYNDGEEPHRERFEGSRDRDDNSFYNPNDDASRDDDRGSSFASSDQDRSDSGNNFADDSASNDDSSTFDSDDNSYDAGGDDSSSSGDDSNY